MYIFSYLYTCMYYGLREIKNLNQILTTEVQFYDFMSGIPGIGGIHGIYQTMPWAVLYLRKRKNYIIDTTDKPFTISEVKKVKKSFKTGKSSGPDLISNEIFKGSCPLIVKSITKLFNMTFSSAIYIPYILVIVLHSTNT